MKAPSIKFDSKFAAKIGCAAFTITVMLIVYVDFLVPSVSTSSDYLCTYWVAAQAILKREVNVLYPSPDETTCANLAFNKFAHQVLPDLAPHTVATYISPPIVAAIYTPLGLLPARLSYFAFQVLCIAAIAVASILICSESAETAFFCSFLFTPLFLVLWIGQCDSLIGAFVFSVMFWLLKKKRHLSAGLVGSIAALKMTLMIAPAFVAVVLLWKRQWRMLAGLGAGCAALVALNLVWFGPAVCHGWLVDLKLVASNFADPKAGAARHLAASLPWLLTFLTPYERLEQTRVLIYLIAAAIGVTALFSCGRLLKQSENADAPAMALAVGSLLIPLCAPYLFYYSLSALLIAGMVVFRAPTGSQTWNKFARRRTLVLWIVMSSYPLLFIVSRDQYTPIVLISAFLIVFVDFVRFAWSKPPAEPTNSKETVASQQ